MSPAVARIPAPIREALAVQAMLRRLGFTPDEIFLSPGEGPKDMLQIVLVQEGREFRYDAGDQGLPRDALIARWIEAARDWNETLTNDERWEIYRTGHVYNQVIELVMVLGRKGFPLPPWACVAEKLRAAMDARSWN